MDKAFDRCEYRLSVLDYKTISRADSCEIACHNIVQIRDLNNKKTKKKCNASRIARTNYHSSFSRSISYCKIWLWVHRSPNGIFMRHFVLLSVILMIYGFHCAKLFPIFQWIFIAMSLKVSKNQIHFPFKQSFSPRTGWFAWLAATFKLFV